MLQTIQWALSGLIVVTLVLSGYYSLSYRRQRDPRRRGLLAARMNIAMGLMLIFIAITQLFFLSDSVLRRTFGTICLLLGFFNLFVGLRNHGLFSRQSS